MLNRILALAMAVLVFLTAACTTRQTRQYAPGEIPVPDAQHRVVAVTRTSGERITFDREDEDRTVVAARVDQGAVVGPVDGEAVRVSLSDASAVSVEERRISIWRTLLLAGGVGITTVAVLVLTDDSEFGLSPR